MGRAGVSGDSTLSTATISPSWRTGTVSTRTGSASIRIGSSERWRRPSRQLDVRVPGRLDHLADEVDRVEGAGGVGAELADDAEAFAAVDGQEQQQVGEGEVGDELPARHQAVQVLDRVVGQPAPDRRGNLGHAVSVAAYGTGWRAGKPLRSLKNLEDYVQPNFLEYSVQKYYPVHLAF